MAPIKAKSPQQHNLDCKRRTESIQQNTGPHGIRICLEESSTKPKREILKKSKINSQGTVTLFFKSTQLATLNLSCAFGSATLYHTALQTEITTPCMLHMSCRVFFVCFVVCFFEVFFSFVDFFSKANKKVSRNIHLTYNVKKIEWLSNYLRLSFWLSKIV